VALAVTDAALFDWDGTLVDSREVLLGAWHEASAAVIGRRFPSTPDEEELVFTLPGTQLFPRVAGDAAGGARLTRAFQDAYARNAHRVRAFDGVGAMLAELRDAGVSIGVVTSKARPRYESDAAHSGLAGLVDGAACQEDTAAHKPDPAPVLHALAVLGATASGSVMTGDTPVDIAAGAAAGTAVVGVAWGASGAQPLLDAGASGVAGHPRELVGLVLDRNPERTRT
jgi:phosphoglycolate phosphatase-like HAD superfamily hydrolase